MPPSRINRQVPAVLDLVVAKALEKNADERYQDAHQFAADLQACLSELGGHRAEPETTLRMGKAAKDGAVQEDDGRTRTLRIGAENGDSTGAEGGTRTRGTRLQNIMVDQHENSAVASFRFIRGYQTPVDRIRRFHAD